MSLSSIFSGSFFSASDVAPLKFLIAFPNDEPMFAYFPQSAAVKNIHRFREHMKHLPAYVADHEGSEGFAQIVGTILTSKAKKPKK